jgi:hypothetical protein
MAAISPCRSTLRVALLRRENDLFNKAADSLERLLLVIFGLKQRGELFDLFAVNLCHIWMYADRFLAPTRELLLERYFSFFQCKQFILQSEAGTPSAIANLGVRAGR